jgi:hypothetical protein
MPAAPVVDRRGLSVAERTEQNDRDYQALTTPVQDGRVIAETGI